GCLLELRQRRLGFFSQRSRPRKLHDLLECGFRSLLVAAFLEVVGQVKLRLCRLGIQLECLLEVGSRALVVAVAVFAQTTRDEELRYRLFLTGCVEQSDALVPLLQSCVQIGNRRQDLRALGAFELDELGSSTVAVATRE